MKKLVVSIVSAAALATIGMAAANGSTVAYNNDANSNAAGIFVSGNLGYGDVNYEKNDFRNTNATTVNAQPVTLNTNGLAWGANLGYQFNQYVAVEMGYTKFADTKLSYTQAVNGVVGNTRIALEGFNLNVKGIMPINDKFDVFAKLGAMRLAGKEVYTQTSTPTGTTTTKFHAWAPMLGVGAAYNVTSKVAVSLQDVYTLRADYDTYTTQAQGGRIPSTNTILAGVSYKFNV